MKRLSTSDPLTADDVADRLNRAMVRTMRILMEVRQTEGLFDEVKRSRYLTLMPADLAAELALWD
jgi:hypothetical protein